MKVSLAFSYVPGTLCESSHLILGQSYNAANYSSHHFTDEKTENYDDGVLSLYTALKSNGNT